MGSPRLHPNESAHPAPPATREDNRGSEPATSQEVNADGGQQVRECMIHEVAQSFSVVIRWA